MANRSTVVIIPARMAATRFPGKPLAMILDLPMIEHVRRRISLCTSVDDVYVATCDSEIREVVESYGGKVIMTADTHERCSDRVEEAATHLDADIVVNVQGDEPVIFPESVDAVVKPFIMSDEVSCSTLVYPIADRDELTNPNIVKAAVNIKNQVMYLTRASIPYFKISADCPLYKESGVRAFRREFLHQYARLSPTPLETVESVDMLRVLEHGFELIAVVTPHVTLGVDVPEDIAIVEKLLREDETQRNLYERILSL
jgi:3-deoxy-manno-octulosonate cytidylyltransferase (CMP-KDO synthetase)